MTKTLIDKWRAGNLKKSFYYLKFPDTETAEIYNLYDMEKFRYVQDSEKIDVLDEVPSYDEHQKLQKKLEIATKALIRIREVCAYNPNQPSYIAQFSNRKVKIALTKMKGVK